jgi:hypothetical protein
MEHEGPDGQDGREADVVRDAHRRSHRSRPY